MPLPGKQTPPLPPAVEAGEPLAFPNMGELNAWLEAGGAQGLRLIQNEGSVGWRQAAAALAVLDDLSNVVDPRTAHQALLRYVSPSLVQLADVRQARAVAARSQQQLQIQAQQDRDELERAARIRRERVLAERVLTARAFDSAPPGKHDTDSQVLEQLVVMLGASVQDFRTTPAGERATLLYRMASRRFGSTSAASGGKQEHVANQ